MSGKCLRRVSTHNLYGLSLKRHAALMGDARTAKSFETDEGYSCEGRELR
tara:strand:- start:136 stop:285 length:150 start_codon:yes stop_codon:yes gene_type:complete